MNFSILAIFSFYFFAQLCVIACMEGNPGGKLPDKANFNEKHPGGKMRVKGTPVGKIEGQASFSGKPGGKFLDNMRSQYGNPALRAYHQNWHPYEAPPVGPITQEEINNYRRHQNVNKFPDLHAPPEGK
ncbi:unnamed protein product [Meloidogyne enterolobii]|uniref:Uncharacterized protein n=1 Tax=Meloidogyne enterolobii TaxID=390850 RepID=A0ACB1B4C7_MELEN